LYDARSILRIVHEPRPSQNVSFADICVERRTRLWTRLQSAYRFSARLRYDEASFRDLTFDGGPYDYD